MKQQQYNLNLESLDGRNKLVAKEMMANQDSHFKTEINKLETMVANNDLGSMVQKSNSTNVTKAIEVPVAAPQIAAPAKIAISAPVAAPTTVAAHAPVSTPTPVATPVAAPAPVKQADPTKDSAAVVSYNEAALEANA